MDRRDTLKTLLISGIAGTAATLPFACKPEEAETPEALPQPEKGLYGRTPQEKARDERLYKMDSVFTEEELATIAILCDIILPATATAGSATDAGVPEFIDFIVKDITSHQLPLKGGLMWLNREATVRYNKPFKELSNAEQIAIVEDIAYPERAKPALQHGVSFFNRMRDLTLTGYYTTQMGIEDLGYQGNRANVWDGVPAEVLKDHDVDYDSEWLAKCVDQSKRNEIAQWDDQGNLLT